MALPNESDASVLGYDNGRRGQPLPGCDCEQCFGYCLVDRDEAMRSRLNSGRAKEEDELTRVHREAERAAYE